MWMSGAFDKAARKYETSLFFTAVALCTMQNFVGD
jgi:hypothetical protein